MSTALGAAEATLLEVDQRVLGVSQPGHSPAAVSGDGGRRSRRQRARRNAAGAARCDSRRYGVRDDQPAARRRAARDRASAAALDWPLAGKTGTVDDYTDAWFVGFDPHITVGVWVGYDEKKPIGNGETGAVTALPIWIDFMRHVHRAARRSQEPADVRSRPATSSFCRSIARPAKRRRGRRRNHTKRSSPARSLTSRRRIARSRDRRARDLDH